jgi:hypothetical protein
MALVESLSAITLSQFGIDLAALGAKQLAYTDMGPWDEGWYRNSKDNKVVTLGQDRSLTNKQSNWLVLLQCH